VSAGEALLELIRHPVPLLIRRWNWKSAFFSSLIRAILFFFANRTAGLSAALGAMAAEYVYRAITSGFYGGLTQHFSQIEPEWEAAAATMAVVPLSSHILEFLVHWLRGTPHLRASIITSVIFTAISTLFHFYAMRRGTMLTGKGGQSVWADLRAFPRLAAGFVCVIPLAVWRFCSRSQGRSSLKPFEAVRANSGLFR
jgi:hypothetical protein